MIPVSLTLKGLYSYQSQQTIAFDKLLDAQLFGIFGSVGSGKSSILEAMTFALYGQSERLDRNDNRNYNMMNLKSDELLIDFVFKSYDEVLYRFTVRGKRNGKDFEKVNTFERIAYKQSGDEWIPMESANAEHILGLSYDNFRRTVIIPQGKFQEFLQLGDKDRTNMLKEIFQLDKYEFFYQTTSLEKRNNEKIQHLTGQLANYNEVKEEFIKEKEQTVAKLFDFLVAGKKNLEEKEKLVNDQQELKKLFQELTEQKSRLETLLERKEEFQSQSKKINDYEYCIRNFKEGLNRSKDLARDIEKRSEVLLDSNSKLKLLTDELSSLEQKFEQLKQSYQQQNERRFLLEDYNTQLALLKVKDEINTLKIRIEKGRPHLEKASSDKAELEDKILKHKELIKAAKNALPDIGVLTAIKAWHSERHLIQRQLEMIKSDLTRVDSELNLLPNSLKALLQPPVFVDALDGHQLDYYVEKVKLRRKQNRQEQEDTASQIAHYNLQLKLGEFAGALSKGGACLLCGSEHHPNVLVVDDVNDHLSVAMNKVEEHKLFDAACELATHNLNLLVQTELNLKRQQQDFERRLQEEEARLARHLEKFGWEKFNRENMDEVEKTLELHSSASAQLKHLEAELDTAEGLCRKASEDYEKFRKAIDEIQSLTTGKVAEQAILLQQIKVLKSDELSGLFYGDIESRIKLLIGEIEQINRDYETILNQINADRAVQISLAEKIKTNKDELEKDQLQINKIHTSLLQTLKQSNFESLHQVEEILSEELDLDRLKSALNQYQQQVYSCQENISKLQDQTAGKSFNEQEFTQLLTALLELKANQQQLNDDYVREKSALDKQKSDLEVKNDLLNQLDVLQKRASNLSTLKQLFKGSGFVNYVSSVYLHNLCEAANQRFYKLTRQTLRLEVTERNEFQVRDFMNNGKVRSVKTLSGGQTFQASLSLALALAESVQQQNKSRQNFFFLDEGFGSLDKESLQIAFETLKSLRKEDRKVGIISHVEDLQQEIDVFLNVTNDPFLGSKVQASWE